jgi:hypothetical protein
LTKRGLLSGFLLGNLVLIQAVFDVAILVDDDHVIDARSFDRLEQRLFRFVAAVRRDISYLRDF